MYMTLPLGLSTPLDKCKARAATLLRNKTSIHSKVHIVARVNTQHCPTRAKHFLVLLIIDDLGAG